MNWNYSAETKKGMAGGLFDLSDHKVVTRNNAADDGDLAFGVAAYNATAGKTVTTKADGTGFAGIVMRLENTEMDMANNVAVAKGRPLSILQHGVIWVKTATGAVCTADTTAYVDANGLFTNASGDDIGAKFTGVTDDGIAVIEL